MHVCIHNLMRESISKVGLMCGHINKVSPIIASHVFTNFTKMIIVLIRKI